MDAQSKLNPQYLAHDVLNVQPHGLWFHEVAEGFSGHGLSFAGQGRMQMNGLASIASPSIAEAYAKVCAKTADPRLREEAVGVLSNTNVRADIYVKSDAPLASAEERGQGLAGVYFHSAPGGEFLKAFDAWNGRLKADFNQPVYADAMSEFADGGVDGAKAFEALSQTHGAAGALAALQDLAGMNFIALSTRPLASESDAEFAPTGLDRQIIYDMIDMPAPAPLPSPLMGSCLFVPLQDRIIMSAMIET